MAQRLPLNPWLISGTALSLVAALLILGDLAFRATERMAVHEFNRRQLVVATEAANGIELYFETLANSLMAEARDPFIRSDEVGSAQAALGRRYDELKYHGLNDIALIGSDGIIKANVNAPQIVGRDFSWRKYFTEARQLRSADSYVIEFIEFKGVDLGKQGVLIAVPLIADITEPVTEQSLKGCGVIVGTLELDSIAERFIAPIGSSGSAQAFLINDEFDLLWDQDRSRLGKNLLRESQGFQDHQERLQAMKSRRSGTVETWYFRFDPGTGSFDSNSYERRLLAYSSVALGQEVWTVGVWAPRKQARRLIRSVYQAQLAVVGMSILITIIGAGYALVSSHRLTVLLRQKVATISTELDAYHVKFETTDRRHRQEIDRASQLAAAGELAAGVAHEIKNPICGICDALRVILDRHEDIRERPIFEEMLLQAERVNKTVRDLLSFARPRAVNIQPMDLHIMLHQVVEFCRDRFGQDGVNLVEVFEAGEALVRADRELLKQVFLNLLMNAAHACADAGGRVELATSRDDSAGTVVVEVSDDGGGIPPEVAGQIFRPFFTTKSKGTGLGLPLSRSIVLQHGGEILAQSQPGSGTKIQVTLPVHGPPPGAAGSC